MSSLSSLLNPSPSGSSQSPVEERKSLLTDDQRPQTHPDAHAHRRASLEYHAAPTETAHDAAQALAALLGSNAPAPTPFAGYSHAASNSPTETPSDTSRLSTHRRPSFYGEATGPIELPQPPQIPRKMSSPTLDQYHVASRSPEQHRRSSFALASDPGLTLAPIKSLDAPADPAPVGQDSSVIITQDSEAHPQELDATKQMQQVADSREPAYVRQEPTTTQIRQPSVSASDAAAPPESSVPGDSLPIPDASENYNDSARTPSNPHSTFTALKQEHSAHAQSPLRESSVPVQSTETTEMSAPVATSAPSSSVPRKRPPPKSAGKKGTASSVKKEPPQKKRKIDSIAAAAKRSGTPSQKTKGGLTGAKRLASTSATPANSSPAPRSVRNGSSPPRSVTSADQDGDAEAQYSEEDEDDEEQGTPDPDADLYCLCRRPDTGTFMIGCDGGCDDWFHGKCVGIAEKDKSLIDRYVCPRCTEKGLGPTTWKRMCRRHGCRMPARTPGSAAKKGKKHETPSKYCSDACGVQYFRELVARTRKVPDASSQKSKAKKPGPTAAPVNNEDLGPRGGIVSAGELKALVNIASGVDEFKRLGEGMLSPPATPSPARGEKREPAQSESSMSPAEQELMTSITDRKDATRARHALLKDRLKFITMVKQTATTIADERGLKYKDFCGFDSRLSWTEDEFNAWRTSPEGVDIIKSGIMPIATDADGDTGMVNGEDGSDHLVTKICDKKRCARHNEWAKLALDDLRFEMSENSEVMRGLDKDEKELVQRAGLRARVLKAGGAGGSVIVHDQEGEHVEQDKDVIAAPDSAVAAASEGTEKTLEGHPELPPEIASEQTAGAAAAVGVAEENFPTAKITEAEAVAMGAEADASAKTLPSAGAVEPPTMKDEQQQQQHQQQESPNVVEMVDATA